MTAVQYELTADDFVEFNHFHHQRSPELHRRFLVSRIFIPLFMVLALLLTPLFMQRNEDAYWGRLTQMKWLFVVAPRPVFLCAICLEASAVALDPKDVE